MGLVPWAEALLLRQEFGFLRRRPAGRTRRESPPTDRRLNPAKTLCASGGALREEDSAGVIRGTVIARVDKENMRSCTIISFYNTLFRASGEPVLA